MKKYLLAGIAALVLAAPVNAAMTCGAANVDVGDTGRNGVVSTYVNYNIHIGWTVHHTLADGQVIDRSTQYAIQDRGNFRWTGTYNRNPGMTMWGQISHANGQPVYDEWLYKDGRVIMHSWALCPWDNRAPPPTPPIIAPPPPSPPIIAQAPTPPAPSSPLDRRYLSPDGSSAPIDSGGGDSVPITSDEDGKHLKLMAGLGSDQFQMMIDTGADTLQITASVSDGLVERGEASPVLNDDGSVAKTIMGMADGHRIELRQLTIHTVTIGSHVLHDIPAIATNDDRGAMLLPGSVLARIGKYSIDPANGKLSFGS